MTRLRSGPLWIALASSLAFSGCEGGQTARSYSIAGIGDASHGKQLIQGYSCGACHVIPGVHGARGLVGPPLIYFSQRTMIAGELPNTPDNLVRWIQHPTQVEPKTAMPDLGLNDEQAHDIAAYLYTIRSTEGQPWDD